MSGVYRRKDRDGKPLKSWAFRIELPAEVVIDPASGKAAINPDTGNPVTRRRRVWHGGFKTRKEAEAALAQFTDNRNKGNYVEPSKMTVGVFLTEEWLPNIERTVRPSTFVSYKLHVDRYLVPNIGDIQLRDLDAGRLNRMFGQLQSSGGSGGRALSKRTVALTGFVIKRALEDARRWGKVVRNVAVDANPPTASKPTITFWTPDQVARFLTTAKTADPELLALWRLAATTGARRGGLLGAKWSDLDLESGKWRIGSTRIAISYRQVVESQPKTAAGRRIVSLDAGTVAALREHRLAQAERRLLLGRWPEHGFVFVDEVGEPLHPGRVSDRFGRIVKPSGLPMIRLHDLRHSRASTLMALGENPAVVAQQLGHTSVSFTLSTYSHVTPNDTKASAQRYADLIDGAI